MSIEIHVEQMVWRESTFEVRDEELDVMVAQGVDVTDAHTVAKFYRDHVGQEVGGVYFTSLSEIADDWSSADDNLNEVTEWWPEGDAPDKYWPTDETDQS